LILADFRKATLDSAVTATAVANNPLNRTIASVYDAVDEELYHINVLAVDNNGKPTQQIVTQQVFDTFGHVVKAVAYNGVFALADYKKVTLDMPSRRRRFAADPLNRITAYAFDGAGQRVYRVRVNAVDANGKPTQEFVEKSVYNSLGLVTQTIGYAGTFALVDFRGSTIDTAVKLAQFANDAKNRSSASAYDTLGRRAYSLQTLAVDSSGKPTQQLVTRLTYDAFGDIIQTTAFATPMVPGDYKLATLDTTVAAHTSALDRTTRYVFDVLGRSRFTLRADGTLAETVYDPHGQTTKYGYLRSSFTFDPNKSYTEAI